MNLPQSSIRGAFEAFQRAAPNLVAHWSSYVSFLAGWEAVIVHLTACPLCGKDSGDGFPHPECCSQGEAYAEWQGEGLRV